MSKCSANVGRFVGLDVHAETGQEAELGLVPGDPTDSSKPTPLPAPAAARACLSDSSVRGQTSVQRV